MLKKCIGIITSAFFVAIVGSTGVSAKPIVLSGTYSRAQVKKDCAATGGYYSSGKTSGYSCVNPKNGNSVVCNNKGHCVGTVISRQGRPPRTIGGILHSPSGGVKTSGGSTPPPNGRRFPGKVSGFKPPSGIKTMGGNRQPPAMIRSAGHNPSGHHK